MATVESLIERLNIQLRTNFLRSYQEANPALSRMIFKFQSGNVETTGFPLMGFMGAMRLFTGTRIIDDLPDTWDITIKNRLWDKAIKIPYQALKRAASNVNGLAQLGIYDRQIRGLGVIAKNAPIDQIMEMLENGTNTTYGTAFDGQPFFSATHAFDATAGNQSNMQTGTGTTIEAFYNDLQAAESRAVGFYVTQGDRKIPLVSSVTSQDIIIIVPPQLFGVANSLTRATEIIVNGIRVNNAYYGMTVISYPFEDPNDWYFINASDDGSGLLPFIQSEEEAPRIDNPLTPIESDPDVRKHNIVVYGVRSSFGTAYGYWPKAIKVVNA